MYGQALMGFRLVDGEYEPIDISPNERGLPSGYSDELGLRLCAMEWSRREELLQTQPNPELALVANHQPWQLMFQAPDTGLYLINMRTMKVEYDRAEADRQRAEAERQQTEQSLAAELAAHEDTRTALQERDARIRELEERLRRPER